MWIKLIEKTDPNGLPNADFILVDDTGKESRLELVEVPRPENIEKILLDTRKKSSKTVENHSLDTLDAV